MNPTITRILGILLCIALLSSLAVAPAVGQTDDEQFLVDLDATGDATVSVSFVYDLNDEDEAAAFDELRENATAQAQITERFENRLSAVAADASEATDREMVVSDPAVSFRRDGDAGEIVLSIEWANLAAVDDDRLTVTEPFASGFEPDRPFTLSAPDGYEITSAMPEPATDDGTSVTWADDAVLDGFEAVAEPAAADGDDIDEDDVDDAAGFGAVVGVLALLSAALLARRRGHVTNSRRIGSRGQPGSDHSGPGSESSSGSESTFSRPNRNPSRSPFSRSFFVT